MLWYNGMLEVCYGIIVWYGMVWYGMVYGMVYGMLWYGMVWCGMVWYMVWNGNGSVTDLIYIYVSLQ